ncbi:hypothetical protein WA158_004618 [Blastocystis sp. Blastoise]
MEKEVLSLLDRLRHMEDQLNQSIEEPLIDQPQENGYKEYHSKIFDLIKEVKEMIISRNSMLDKNMERIKIIEANALIFRKMKEVQEVFMSLELENKKDIKKKKKLTQEQLEERQNDLVLIGRQIKVLQSMMDERNRTTDIDETIDSYKQLSTFDVKKSELDIEKDKLRHELMGDTYKDDTYIEIETNRDQEMYMEQLLKQDQAFDQILDVVSDGLDELQNYATAIGDEVDKQNKMLSDLADVVDITTNHVSKTTKNTSKANFSVKGDKCCVSLILILIIVGLGVVIFNLIFRAL